MGTVSRSELPLINPTLASAAVAVRLGLSGDELALIATGEAEQLAGLPVGGRRGYSVDATTGEIFPPGAPLPARRVLYSSLRITLSGPADGQGGPLEIIAGLAGGGWTLVTAPLLEPSLDRSVPAIRARPADLLPEGVDGRGVLVGVVDFGCDFAHPSFLEPAEAHPEANRSRLLFLWDQNGEGGAERIGTVFERDAIERALREKDPYGALGYFPHLNCYAPANAGRDGLVHGTHVMGVAAGQRYKECPAGVAPGASLAFVHLRPGAMVSCGDAADVFDGACAVFHRAAQLGMPSVVNLSLGANWGSHDGNMIYDGALDALLACPGRAITVAAGNERQSGLNVDGQVGADAPVTLRWRFRQGDGTPNTLRVFAATAAGLPGLACTVRIAGGETTLDSAAGPNARWLSRAGAQAGLVYSGLAPDGGDTLQHIEIRLIPSGAEETVEVVLSTASALPVQFDAWIERDDRAEASQSSFDLAAPLTRSTLTCTACGRRTLTVGAFDHGDPARPAAPFSGEGLTRDGRRKPDVAAPGTNVLAPGAYGGRAPPGDLWVNSLSVTMSGTSVAAPHAAGVVALMLQAEPGLTAERGAEILRATAVRDGAGDNWDARLGAGRLDAAAALRRLV